MIDLGRVPRFASRPVYESVFDDVYDFIPGVENIIHRLSNEEMMILREATYSTGWYIDVHSSPFLPAELPEIRADAEFEDDLEVAASIVDFPPPPGTEDQGVDQEEE